jgi:hypothetical protein
LNQNSITLTKNPLHSTHLLKKADKIATIKGAEKNTTYISTKSNLCSELNIKKVAVTINSDLNI